MRVYCLDISSKQYWAKHVRASKTGDALAYDAGSTKGTLTICQTGNELVQQVEAGSAERRLRLFLVHRLDSEAHLHCPLAIWDPQRGVS